MTLPGTSTDLHDEFLRDLDRAFTKLTLGAGKEAAKTAPGARPAFHRILVCHDGTPASARALEWGSHLARLHGARVVVTSVVPPPELPGEGMHPVAWWPEMLESYGEIARAIHDAAESAVDLLRADGVPAEAVAPTGPVLREIVRVAKERESDLVIVGAKGRGAVRRALLGSTADALLSRLATSILVARTAPPAGRVLAAADGSPSSHRATAYALRYAAAAHAHLTVQHVLEYAEDLPSMPPEGYLKGVVDKMQLPEHPRVSYVLDVGRPAERIVTRAAERGAGLIVMGARGLGAIGSILLGSVSHRVANTAETNVLVVREPAG